MSFRGDLIKAGIDSDGVNIDFFRSDAKIKRAGTPFSFVHVDETVVDASGGGEAETSAIGQIPAGAILLGVSLHTNVAFDGNATQTVDIGVSGDTDAYIANTALDSSSKDSVAGDAPMEYAHSDIDVIATWTNHDSATEGEFTVRLIYVVQ